MISGNPPATLPPPALEGVTLSLGTTILPPAVTGKAQVSRRLGEAMTAKPCPICGVPIEEADLHEHLTGLHKNSPIEEMPGDPKCWP